MTKKNKSNIKERDYTNLSWEELTEEEQKRFKVRYTILKLTEILTIATIGFCIYWFYIY